MPSSSDPLRHLAQGAISMLLSDDGYWKIYRYIKSHAQNASASSIRATISLAKQALGAVTPQGSQNRFRVGDIPEVGRIYSDVPSISGNLRFSARGLVTFTDPETGSIEYRTVFFTYDRLPSRSRILRDLESQFYYQMQSSRYPGRKTSSFDPSTVDVSFVAFTRAF